MTIGLVRLRWTLGAALSALTWGLLNWLQHALPLPILTLSPGWRWGVTGFFALDALLTIAWSLKVLAPARRTNLLAATGPYRLIRHPLYATILWNGTAITAFALQSWLTLLAVAPLHLLWIRLVRPEEEELRKLHGAAYRDYADRTGQFFPSLAALRQARRDAPGA